LRRKLGLHHMMAGDQGVQFLFRQHEGFRLLVVTLLVVTMESGQVAVYVNGTQAELSATRE
jgi:hypothetical protein